MLDDVTTATETHQPPPPTATQTRVVAGRSSEIGQHADRARWLALYVLCAGVLMIVLDGTIVNVALPTIQRELGFSQSALAWVINAYLIAFGGLLLLAGRLGDLTSRRGVFVGGLAVFTTASLACGLAQDQTMLVAARFVQGAGGAATSAVGLGMIVTMFPKPHEQAKAIGVYAFVASAGGSIGLLAGGADHAGARLALDLLRERADRDRHGGARTAPDRARQGHRLARQGADMPGAVLITGALMLSVYTIVKPAAEDGWGAAKTLELGARRGGAAGGVRGARGDRAHAADPAADLPLAQRQRGEPDPGADGGGDVLGVLPRRAVHAEGAPLRRAADRPGVPADDARDGRDVAATQRTVDHALRRAAHADPGARGDRGGPRAVHARAGARQLRERHPADDDPDGRRHRQRVPGADEARDVGRHAGRRGPGLGPGQHDRAGRRRAGAGGGGDARGDPHQPPARRAGTPKQRR